MNARCFAPGILSFGQDAGQPFPSRWAPIRMALTSLGRPG